MSEITGSKETTPADEERTLPKVKTDTEGGDGVTMRVTGDIWRLMDAAGGEAVTLSLLDQIANLGSRNKQVDDDVTNFVVGVVDKMDPNDPVEAMLLTQMAATHQAAMMMARRLNRVELIPQIDSAERAANKLMRTYTAQMETLRKYRNGGNQTVTVQHVNVEDGGQAIVGNVEAGGTRNEKK